MYEGVAKAPLAPARTAGSCRSGRASELSMTPSITRSIASGSRSSADRGSGGGRGRRGGPCRYDNQHTFGSKPGVSITCVSGTPISTSVDPMKSTAPVHGADDPFRIAHGTAERTSSFVGCATEGTLRTARLSSSGLPRGAMKARLINTRSASGSNREHQIPSPSSSSVGGTGKRASTIVSSESRAPETTAWNRDPISST